MFTALKAPWKGVPTGRAVLCAIALTQIGACAAFYRQVPVPEILAQPAKRAAAAPMPLPDLAPIQIALSTAPARYFVDRFQTIDAQRWRVHDRGPNGAWAANAWRPSQVVAGPGGVRLSLQRTASQGPGSPSGPDFVSGEMSTLAGQKSGYVEAQLTTASGAGAATSVLTYGSGEGAESPHRIEFQILGRKPTQVELTLHAGGKTTSTVHKLGFDASKGAHAYGVDWRAGQVRWYIDSKLVHEVKGGLADHLTQDQNLHVNVWGSNTLPKWMGKLDPARNVWTTELVCAAKAETYPGRSLCAVDASPMPAAVTTALDGRTDG